MDQDDAREVVREALSRLFYTLEGIGRYSLHELLETFSLCEQLIEEVIEDEGADPEHAQRLEMLLFLLLQRIEPDLEAYLEQSGVQRSEAMTLQEWLHLFDREDG